MSCPFCGSAASAGARSCPTCGGVLAPWLPPPVPPGRATARARAVVGPGCWSCAGTKGGAGPCPWCGAPADPPPVLDPEEAEAERQRVRWRSAVIGVATLLVLSVLAAASVAARTGQWDDAWNEDRAEAAALVKQAVDGLRLDPANPDGGALQDTADRLDEAAFELADAEGHEEERQRLAEHLSEFRQGFDRLATLMRRGPNRISDNVVSVVTSAWDGLRDDADGIAELTGVRIDVGSARAKIDAFVEGTRRAARKAEVEAHRQEVSAALSEVVPLKTELDRSGIASREAGPGLIGIEFDLRFMARDRRELAARLRSEGVPTPALDERVEAMTGALDDAAEALEDFGPIEGGCEQRSFFEFVCPKIGDLPAYKELVAQAAALDARFAAARQAWAAEVDAEIARTG